MQENEYQAMRVKDDIIVVQVSQRKYRLAQQVNDGSGYSNFDLGEVGITNIRRYEFISGSLDLRNIYQMLREYVHTKPVTIRV